MLAVVAPVLHRKLYGAVPPLGLQVNVRELPAQIVALAGVTVHVGCGFTVSVALHVVVQPLESVTVTVYVPATLTEMPEVVAPLLHKKVYGAVPPLGPHVNVCEPPAQIAATGGVTVQFGFGLTVNVALHVVMQPWESVDRKSVV